MEDFRRVIRKNKEIYPDLRRFSRRQKIFGYLDMKACIVRINCSKMKYDHDCARFYADMLPVGYTTTFFHELTHYYQMTTMTNGMFMSLLEDFQIIQTARLKSVLKNISYPFIGNMLADQRKQDTAAEKCLHNWYAAELIKCLLGCDMEKFDFLMEDTIFSGQKISEIFDGVEREICKEFDIPYTDHCLNDNIFELPSDISEAIEKNASPFENHARMAEFWWDAYSRKNPFTDGGADLYEYSGWIQVFARYVSTDHFADFLASFMAICELAQFAPVFPGLGSIKEQSVYDFLPSYRMGKLIYSASDIPPVSGINDYNRYLDQLAMAAGYTPVTDLCSGLLEHRWQEEGAYFWSDLFYNAIRIRKDNFSTFFNYGFWHPLYQKIEPYTEYFLKLMPMPVVVFDDYVEIKSVQGKSFVFSGNSAWDEKLRLPDKYQETAIQIIVRDVFRQYFYTIMTGWGRIEKGTVYIECPILAGTGFRKIIEERTKQYIFARFGFWPQLNLYQS